MASHTIPKPQQPQEESQKLASITKTPNSEQVIKHEPQSKGQVAQQVPPLANQDIPQEHER